MDEIGYKQLDNIENYVLNNLDRLEKSDLPKYDYRILIGLGRYVYIKVEKDYVTIRTRFIWVNIYDNYLVSAFENYKPKSLLDKIKSFIKKMIGRKE